MSMQSVMGFNVTAPVMARKSLLVWLEGDVQESFNVTAPVMARKCGRFQGHSGGRNLLQCDRACYGAEIEERLFDQR